MNLKTKGILAFAGATVAGSGIPVFSKIVMLQTGPTEMMMVRFLIASLVLFPFVYRSIPKSLSSWSQISLATLPGVINMVLFANGVRLTTAMVATLIYSLCPIVAAVIVHFLGQEKINRQKILGITAGFLGMLILVIGTIDNSQTGQAINALKGNLLILIGMLCWTIYTIASKPLNGKFPTSAITFYLLVNGFLLNFILGGYRFFTSSHYLTINNTTWFWLVYLGLVCSIGFFLLYQLTIKYSSAVISLMIGYVQPVLTFIWAAVLLGEKLNSILVIAGILTLAGAYITTTAKTNPN